MDTNTQRQLTKYHVPGMLLFIRAKQVEARVPWVWRDQRLLWQKFVFILDPYLQSEHPDLLG